MTEWMTAALWLLITALQCYQWYWYGRDTQKRIDKKFVDEKVGELVERVDGILARHLADSDPNGQRQRSLG